MTCIATANVVREHRFNGQLYILGPGPRGGIKLVKSRGCIAHIEQYFNLQNMNYLSYNVLLLLV